MALNTTISKAEEDEKKRAIEEKRLAILERDKANVAAIFNPNGQQTDAMLNPTMDTIRNTPEGMSLEAPANPNVAVASVTPGTNTWNNTPGKLTGVEQSVVDMFTSSEEPAPVVEETPKNKLQSDLAVLKQQPQVGVTPRQQAPLSVSPVHPQYEAGSFNEVEQNNGLPLGYLSNTAMIESGNNPNAQNPNSTAKGLFQFIDSTATSLGLQDPMDPKQATDAMVKLTNQNQEVLRKQLGREPTGEELYIMHQQGQNKGLKILQGDPNANAVQVLGRAEVLNNGGNENMTVGEFKNLWGAKYNRISGTTQEVAPAITPVDDVDGRLANSDKGVSAAIASGISPAAATAAANVVMENGRGIIKADEGFNFDGDFQHRNRETSDSGALWQGVLAGGVGMLIAALAGGSKEDIGASFAVGAASRFTDAMNQSHRYKNVDVLKKQGYTAESVESYIQTGDRSQLTKHQIGEWKAYPDGSGRMMRTLPNGDTELREGQPKWEVLKEIDENGDEYTTYYNDFYGQRMKTDENGNKVPFRHRTGVKNVNRLDTQAGATPQTYVHTSPTTGKKEEVTVFTTPNGFVSVTDRKTPVNLGADAQLKEKATKGKNLEANSTDAHTQRLQVENYRNLLADIANDPAMGLVTGFAGKLGKVQDLYSSDYSTLIQKFENLGGKTFLDNIQNMKGFGSLSNAEGAALRLAASGLFDTETGKFKTGLKPEYVQTQLKTLLETSIRMGMYDEEARARGGLSEDDLTPQQQAELRGRVDAKTAEIMQNSYPALYGKPTQGGSKENKGWGKGNTSVNATTVATTPSTSSWRNYVNQ